MLMRLPTASSPATALLSWRQAAGCCWLSPYPACGRAPGSRARAFRCASLHRDVAAPDDVSEHRRLDADPGAEVAGVEIGDAHAAAVDLVADLGGAQRGGDRLVEPGDGGGRRTGGSEDPEPGI